MDKQTRIGVLRWLIKQIVFMLLFGAAFFIPAGRLNRLGGWAYLAAMAVSTVANAVTLKPDLLIERSSMRAGVKKWDIGLSVSMAILGPLLILIVGGLDVRNEWSPAPVLAVRVAAWIVGILGVLFTVWAMAANPFFSGLVRIQADRGHTVAAGGPYRWMRHPGYAGAILFDLAVPLFLGSLWAWIPTALTIIVIVVRTALEDKTLRAELAGYQAYANRVRFRLLPGIW
ncbi:MAG: isoprenylcysteine carboxylmethyltransferase family protein [Anaerolineae bacterium]|nr:isoprenylcysteine carboxylmethyltransferase family protein [Anaerolineae bacterium]